MKKTITSILAIMMLCTVIASALAFNSSAAVAGPTIAMGEPTEANWSKVEAIQIANPQTAWFGNQTGATPSSFKMLWDENNLYVRITYGKVPEEEACGELRITNKSSDDVTAIFFNLLEGGYRINPNNGVPYGYSSESVTVTKPASDTIEIKVPWAESLFDQFTAIKGSTFTVQIMTSGKFTNQINDEGCKSFTFGYPTSTQDIDNYNYGNTNGHATCTLGDKLITNEKDPEEEKPVSPHTSDFTAVVCVLAFVAAAGVFATKKFH